MTFNSAAWAVDGARITSELPRRAVNASTNGAEGISKSGDLKVSQLSPPGRGLQITGGSALVLNRYQGADPNETYTVANRGTHILSTPQLGSAFNSAPVVRHFLVCVTIGDPTGTQAGHPWMTGETIDNPTDFEYVRPWLIPCNAETETFAELGIFFPALALARLRVPAGAGNFTDADITELRQLAIPRTKIASDHLLTGAANALNGNNGNPGAYERWPNKNVVATKIPEWAVRATIMGFVEGVILKKAGAGKIRAAINNEGLATPVTNINESAPRPRPDNNDDGKAPQKDEDRVTYNIGGQIEIPKRLRGTRVGFCVEGTPENANSKGFLITTGSTSVMMQILFEEVPE